MVTLSELWLPILLAAVLVFVASSVIHMALQVHKGDYKKLPGEAEVLEAMRRAGVQPGQYMFPCPGSMKDMGSPEMQAKYQQGPVGSLIVIPSSVPPIGKSLIQWFVYSVVVSLFVAYVAAHGGLPRGAEWTAVFRLTGAVAVLAYGTSHVVDSIWKGLSWSVTIKFIIDGVVYGLLTAVTFAWMWPAAGA